MTKNLHLPPSTQSNFKIGGGGEQSVKGGKDEHKET